MKQEKLFPASIYVGIEGGADKNTNEMIHGLLEARNLSKDFVGKEYKGEDIKVWEVNPDFIKTLYADKHDLRLKFIVYMERAHTLQRFRLLEPAIIKKARNAKRLKQILAHVGDEM